MLTQTQSPKSQTENSTKVNTKTKCTANLSYGNLTAVWYQAHTNCNLIHLNNMATVWTFYKFYNQFATIQFQREHHVDLPWLDRYVFRTKLMWCHFSHPNVLAGL